MKEFLNLFQYLFLLSTNLYFKVQKSVLTVRQVVSDIASYVTVKLINMFFAEKYIGFITFAYWAIKCTIPQVKVRALPKVVTI